MLAAGTCGAAIHQLATPLNDFLAYADPLAYNGNVFVLINLSGGCSLNISPYYLGAYRDKFPTVSWGPENSIPLNSEQGLHPELTLLKELWDEGKLAVNNLIGNGPSHSRSHEIATWQWETQYSTPTAQGRVGWGAQLTSQLQSAFGGVSLAGVRDVGRGGPNPPRVISSLSSLGEPTLFGSTAHTMHLASVRTNFNLSNPDPKSEAQQQMLEGMNQLQGNLEVLKPFSTTTLPASFTTAVNNTDFGRKLGDAWRLIRAGPALGISLIILNAPGGYDHHSNSKSSLANNLRSLNEGLTAFINGLKSSGDFNRVAVLTLSEFGRSYENESQGEDHGTSSTHFVFGGNVIGGIKTPPPTAEDLANPGYIKTTHGTHMQVIASILQNHLGLDPSKVFMGDIAYSPYIRVI